MDIVYFLSALSIFLFCPNCRLAGGDNTQDNVANTGVNGDFAGMQGL